MLLIWYPSDDAGKIVGISPGVKRPRGIKVPMPRSEFGGQVCCRQMRHLSRAFIEFCHLVKGWGLLAIEQTNSAPIERRSTCLAQ